MKKLFTALLLLMGLVSFSQTTGYFRYDSIRFEKVGGNSEFILLNGTRNVTGGVLTNLGNGRTGFVTPSGSSSLFARTDARNNTGSHAYFSNATKNLTLDSNHLLKFRGDTITIIGGNTGFKTLLPEYAISIGDDISGNATLHLYAPNSTAAFLQAKTGADLGVTGGGKIYLKPNGYIAGGQTILDPSPSGYIRYQYQSGGGSVVANVGIDTLNALGYQFYIEPVNVGLVTTHLDLKGSILTPNIAQITDSTGYDIYAYRRSDGMMKRIPSNLIGAPTGGGSGADNSNAGSGYRWLKPTSQGIKTAFAGIGILIDSSSNTDGLTFKSDTLVNQTWSRGIKLVDSMVSVNNTRYWNLSGNSATAGSQAGSWFGTSNSVALRIRTNNTQRILVDSSKAQLQIGSPTVDNVNALLIQGLSNSTNEGIKVYSNNLSANSTMAWNGFTSSGDMALTANTGNINMSFLSSKGVGVGVTPTSDLDVMASTTSRSQFRLRSGSLPTGGAILAGNVDNIGDKIYFTASTGPTQYEFTLNSAALTANRIPFVNSSGYLQDLSTIFVSGNSIVASGISTGSGTTTNTNSYLNGTVAPSSGSSGYVTRFAGTIQENSASNHPLLTGIYVEAPTISANSATVTDISSLFINAAPTGTISGRAYAFKVNAGESYLNGAVSYAIASISSTTTLDVTHHTVKVDASGGAVTVNLPDAATCTGRKYNIKKMDASGNAVTLDGSGSQTIDGATTVAITTQYTNYTIQSDGSNWVIL